MTSSPSHEHDLSLWGHLPLTIHLTLTLQESSVGCVWIRGALRCLRIDLLRAVFEVDITEDSAARVLVSTHGVNKFPCHAVSSDAGHIGRFQSDPIRPDPPPPVNGVLPRGVFGDPARKCIHFFDAEQMPCFLVRSGERRQERTICAPCVNAIQQAARM